MAEWVPDVLGDEFEQLTLPLEADDEGEVVATLVRAMPEPDPAPSFWGRMLQRLGLHAPAEPAPLHDVDVLYVHGWSDYFFHKRLARFWTGRGARFFALDLRKYGRSIREWQSPGYVRDLAAYDEDIAAALDVMGTRAQGRALVLLGHSTGGLTLSLWASRHPGQVSAVILNAPWLEFQLAPIRAAITPVIELGARLRPYDAAPQIDLGFYARAQAEVADPADPLEPNPLWRPEHAMSVYAGWFRAVLDGHATVSRGLQIDAPVCVLLSKRSTPPTRWSDALTESDSVLVVEDIARAALKLGNSVTVERIEGALHDVFLSRRAARDDAYARMARWVDGWNATR